MIHIYYGNGKGKTSAALGLALRADGAGKSVYFVSFLKDNSSSERKAKSNINFYENPNAVKFLFNMTEQEKADYALWVQEAIKNALCSNADVVILDELLDVLGLLPDGEAESFLFDSGREYVITGHVQNDCLFEKADYITFFKKEKHPYDKGVPARKGIEF